MLLDSTMVFADASSPLTPEAPVHAVRMPKVSPLPEHWVCAGDGSSEDRRSDRATFALTTLRDLGACPGGEPVAGTIELCDRAPGGCPNAINDDVKSTLAAATFDVIDGTADGGSFACEANGQKGGGVVWRFHLPGAEHGWLVASFDATGTNGYGIALIGKTPDDPGTMYCIDHATIDCSHVSAGGFTKLGSCSSAKVVSGILEMNE